VIEKLDATIRAITAAILAALNAVLSGHFVLKNATGKEGSTPPGRGDHSGAYVDKDIASMFPAGALDRLGALLALRIFVQGLNVDVIACPAIGAIGLCHAAARYLSLLMGKDIKAIFVEEKDGAKTVARNAFKGVLNGKNVLVIEDIVTTGGSLEGVIVAVKACGANVTGACVMVMRGSRTAEDLGVPWLYVMQSVVIEKWVAAECPLCKSGTPINPKPGHGDDFLKIIETENPVLYDSLKPKPGA